MRQRRRVHIYRSKWHLAATAFFLLAPFAYLLFFSRITNITAGRLLADVGVSVSRVAAAYIISLFLAWGFAILFYRGKRSALALPIFDVLQSFPTFAALPLAVSYWGATEFTVVFFLIFAIIWPIFFSVLSSLKLMKHEWEEAVAIAGLSGSDYLRLLVIPVSIPAAITGSLIGLGDAWEAIVATEVIVRNPIGLGSFFTQFSTNPEITTFGILGFLILIFSINRLVWTPLLEWSHRYVEE